jgi:hypothetical protein
MRLSCSFCIYPTRPALVSDISDDGLPAFIHGDVFDDHSLLAFAAIPLEGLDLGRESSGKLVQRSFVNVHLFQGPGPLPSEA